ncbi:uncharacterized protein LOC129289273 [Prosopis cineraria]|uniref:uncharacterized protein LOC129289273 n=1 Tax=Prosopis cineraria TaxID=364024 RepID=UPI00240FCDD7|nr:uncharacterized protein LOC129289273 [Prosopis cineraria]
MASSSSSASASTSSSASASASEEIVYVEQCKGIFGLDKFVLREVGGHSAEVYLYGAQVLSWKNHHGKEMLFLSKKAEFKPSKPIRGGIQMCFPEFTFRNVERYGFARTRFWTVDPSPPPLPNERTRRAFIDLILKYSDEDRFVFPHKYEYRLRVSLAPEGNLTLISRIRNINRDGKPFTFSFAYNSHFLVPDIGEVRIEGFETYDYLDNLKNKERFTEQGDSLTFEEEIDRVYLNTSNKIAIIDHGRKKTYVLRKDGLPDAGVWNPWEKKAKAILGKDEYLQMVNVQPARVEKGTTIKPGEEWKGKLDISLSLSSYNSGQLDPQRVLQGAAAASKAGASGASSSPSDPKKALQGGASSSSPDPKKALQSVVGSTSASGGVQVGQVLVLLIQKKHCRLVVVLLLLLGVVQVGQVLVLLIRKKHCRLVVVLLLLLGVVQVGQVLVLLIQKKHCRLVVVLLLLLGVVQVGQVLVLLIQKKHCRVVLVLLLLLEVVQVGQVLVLLIQKKHCRVVLVLLLLLSGASASSSSPDPKKALQGGAGSPSDSMGGACSSSPDPKKASQGGAGSPSASKGGASSSSPDPKKALQGGTSRSSSSSPDPKQALEGGASRASSSSPDPKKAKQGSAGSTSAPKGRASSSSPDPKKHYKVVLVLLLLPKVVQVGQVLVLNTCNSGNILA